VKKIIDYDWSVSYGYKLRLRLALEKAEENGFYLQLFF